MFSKQSTARTVMVLVIAAADHIAGLPGATLTIQASKAGSAFATITPTVADLGAGWYSLALTAAHTDTLGDLALRITAASADPCDVLLRIVAFDPDSASNLGLSALDAAVSSRMATFAYTAPPTVAAIRTEMDANSTKLDVAVSSRLAAAGYTAPDNASIATILADTNDIQTRLPAALVSGRMDSSVGAMATDVITAAAVAASAVTELQSGLATAAAQASQALSTQVDALEGDTATLLARLTSTRAALLDNLDAAISSRLAAAGYTAPPSASAIRAEMDANSTRLVLIERLLRNKAITNPATGTMTIFADDGVTPLLTCNLYQDAAGTIPYQGQGAERRERLV